MNEHISQLTQQPVDDEALKGIAILANQQLDWEIKIAELEKQTEDAKEQLARIRDTLLPDAMLGVGMSSFKLADGTAVIVNKFYSASIPEDRKRVAFAWLRGNGFSEIIKREIKAKFGKGDDEIASEIAMEFARRKIAYEDKEAVHPMTLKAFVREQIEAGRNLPMEDLGVYIGNRAKITPANK